MSKSLPGLILLLLLAFSSKADQPIFNISSAQANIGETVEINFVVDDFVNLISAQYSINWDPAVLEFVSLKNLNGSVNGLTSSSFNVVDYIDEGKITFLWFEPALVPVSLPDGTLLYTLEFDVIGEPCTEIGITSDPLEIEVSEDGEVEVGLVSNDGLFLVPGATCAQGINLIGNSVTASCGEEACIRFTVENFTNVVSMEFSLAFDPAIIQFDRFQNFAPLTAFSSGNTNLLMPGLLRVVWTSANAENESLPDGTTLFEICFDVIGGTGQSTTIDFGNNPPPEFYDEDINPHEVNMQPAVINSQCALQGFAFIGDTVCTEPNGIVCMDVLVNDFIDIITFQMSLNWDSTVFRFDHVEGFNLPDLTAESFGEPGNPDVKEGQLNVLWFDQSLNGVTVADFSSIFTICLEAVGPAGSSSPITFSNNPLPIEVADANDSIINPILLQGFGEIKLNCDDSCVISYTLTPTSPNCPREATGALNLNLDIGSCPCTPSFVWSTTPPVTTEDLTGVEAGTYTVTITVCEQIVVASGTITDPPAIEASWNVTNPSPPSSSTGAIDLMVTGGTPPYSYLWNTTPPMMTEDLSGIPAGTYRVTITDSRGCTFIPDPIIVGADLPGALVHVTCPGLCNGSISVSPTFGNPPYTYAWNTVPPQSTSSISNLCAGTYCVTVTESGGSTRDTCYTITQPPALNVSASITHDVNEDCHGAIDLNVTGGTNPISYMWSNSATSQDIINLCPGLYCVTITYGLGCAFDTCFTVSGNIGVSLTVTQPGCSDVCDGEIMTVVNGVEPFTYTWSNTATSANLTGLCPGIYSVTVTDAVGNTASASTTIAAPPPLTFTTIITLPTDFASSDGSISVIASGGVPPYTYEWVGPVTGNAAAMNNLPAGTYFITVTDMNDCEFTMPVALLPDVEGLECYQGNKIITPNDDGKNDYFIILCVLNTDHHLSIFNRFGGLVYQTSDYNNNWTGVDNDGQLLSDGGYLWVLEVNNAAGIPQIYKGVVNVLRTAD